VNEYSFFIALLPVREQFEEEILMYENVSNDGYFADLRCNLERVPHRYEHQGTGERKGVERLKACRPNRAVVLMHAKQAAA
jgi:hypothetical protein